MSFLGLQIGNIAPPRYRLKRFGAFVIDVIIILCLLAIAYYFTGKPDFPAVKAALDASQPGDPDGQQAQADVMLKLFNTAFLQTLLIWFVYEVVCQILFAGATLGKLVMKMRIVPLNPGRNRFVHQLMMIVRSAVKFLFLYLFQGFPFFIASLSIFANKEGRSGFDIIARTSVIMKE